MLGRILRGSTRTAALPLRKSVGIFLRPELHRPIVTGNSPLLPTRRFCSSKKDDGNEKKNEDDEDDEDVSDYEIYQTHRGFIARMYALGALSGHQAYDFMSSLKDYGPKSAYRALLLLSDVNHPLLLKYKFDIGEFVKGVGHAILELKGAFFSKEVCDMRASGVIKHSPESDFLRQVLASHLFLAVFWPLIPGESDCVATSLDLKHVVITRVHTVLVDEKFIKDREELLKVAGMVASIQSSVGMGPVRGKTLEGDDAVEVDDVVPNADGTVAAGLCSNTGNHYPVGSVLAQVDVSFVIEEDVRHSKLAPPEQNGQDSSSGPTEKRRSQEKWTFEACISGHVEQHWIVSHFHRLNWVAGRLP